MPNVKENEMNQDEYDQDRKKLEIENNTFFEMQKLFFQIKIKVLV